MAENKTKPTDASGEDYKVLVEQGRVCYLKRLDDLDKAVLEELVIGSVAVVRRRYGQHGGA